MGLHVVIEHSTHECLLSTNSADAVMVSTATTGLGAHIIVVISIPTNGILEWHI